MSADVRFTKSECVSRYNRSGPRGAGNTGPGLTHSSGTNREGLGMEPTQFPPSIVDPLHIARFWSKVEVGRPGVCWEWRAARSEHGYGIFKLPNYGPTAKAHRVAWELANGRKLVTEEHLLHACDNPPCVNPSHLSIGTQADNTADMVRKGRQCRGSSRSKSLTDADVVAIRELAAAGEMYAAIAARFSISPGSVSMIAAGERWTHVGGPITRLTDRTHCKQRGHEMTEENTYITSRGHRKCRACIRISQAKYVQNRNRSA